MSKGLAKTKKRIPYQGLRDACGLEKFEQIQTRLIAGTSPSEMADIIQKEWKVMLTSKRSSLVKMLQRIREKEIAPRLAESVGKIPSGKRDRLIASYMEGLDVEYEMKSRLK